MEFLDYIAYIKLVQGKIKAYSEYADKLYQEDNADVIEKLKSNRKLFDEKGTPLNVDAETYKEELEKMIKDSNVTIPKLDREKVIGMLIITEKDIEELIKNIDDNKGTE